MKVAELMRPKLMTVTSYATLTEAIVTLADAHVSGLPVVDGQGGLVGVVTTTDVLNAIAETDGVEGRNRVFRDTEVKDIMTAKPLTIEPEADVMEVARRMLYLEVRRLFVEHEGKLVGVLSQTDIVGALAAGKL